MSFGLAEAGQQQFRLELVAQERATAQRLQAAYTRLIDPTVAEIQRLEAAAQSVEEFERLADLNALREHMATSLDEMEWMLQAEGERLSASAANLGVQYAEVSTGLTVGWSTPDPAAVRRLADFMERPAMQEAIGRWAPYHAQQVVDLALSGIAQGWNPNRTAAVMRQYVEGMPLADAQRMMRTVQLWSYRGASLEGWQENPNVVRGWTWSASLGDPRTCIGCISMHGTHHTLDEMLDDHHRGRCGMIPDVVGRPLPAENAGEVWFRSQPEATQIQTMGRARWLAWQDGAFNFSQLNRTYEDPIYGQMRTENSLNRLVGTEAARDYQSRARAALPRDVRQQGLRF